VGGYFPTVLLDHLHKEFPEGDFIDLSDRYRDLRRIKDSSEMRLIKRAAILARQAARALTNPGIFGKKEADLSAQAEWMVRSRGGEDYQFSCASGETGYLDFPKGREIRDWFAFSLLTQYKGCRTLIERTSVSAEVGRKRKEDVQAYQGLVSGVQGEGSVDRLEKVIKEAEAQHWVAEIKSPIGPDTPSSVISGLGRVPREKGTVFSLTFHRETGPVPFVYGETLFIGEEGYEVWTL
jgi:hypothetical protein